jgi:hypothetical protein
MKKLYSHLLQALPFKFAVIFALIATSLELKAQTTTYSSYYVGVGGASEVSDSLYLGPGLFELDGDWEIYCEYILIDPNAVFSGTGRLMVMNPGVSTGTSASTKLDANSNTSPILVAVALQNNATTELKNLNFPTDLTSSAGWTEVATSSLSIGSSLTFGIDNGHLLLNAAAQGNLRLGDTATLVGYRPNRHVVTNNSIVSHLIKEDFTSAFVFPIGISTNNYTPAQISNASSNTIYVSVQDYASSASPEALIDGTVNLADGINRSWHIYADNASISSNINLQHNGSTNQSGYADAACFVTQWGTSTPNTSGDNAVPFSSSPWQTNTQAAGITGTLSSTGSVAGSSMRSRTYSSGLATSTSANQSYFTKSSDAAHPLPVVLTKFDAQANKCDVVLKWEMGDQSHASAYHLMHSTDAQNYELLANLNPQSNSSSYQFVHKNAGSGSHYYRLQIMGNMKDVVYSPTIPIKLDCDLMDEGTSVYNVSIYPNPAINLIHISGLNNGVDRNIRILSLEGKIVYERKSAASKVSIDISQFAAAYYFVQIIEQDRVLLNTKFSKL